MATERPLGTASWASHEYAVEQYRHKPGSLWLGRSPMDEATPLGFDDDRHVLVAGGSRGGKGTTFIVPNLIQWLGSVVVVDPKGENATLTAARRGPGSKHCDGMGQEVHVLDPFREATVPEELRSRFNPLDVIDPDDPEAVDLADMIASAMVVIPEKEGTWEEDACEMLSGLILHVIIAEQFEGRRNLLTVRRLLMHGDQETVELLQKAGETDIASAQALLWEGLRSNPAFDGVISGIGAKIGDMYGAAPKQFEGVHSAARRNTRFLDSPRIRRCVEASNFALSDLKTNPKGMSLYLSLPDRYRTTHRRWLRMMVNLTLNQLEATKGQPACGHRVLMCLDEFAGLGRMESIEDAVAKIAGYGVKLLFAVQSFAQLKTVYKDNWETFYTNCACKMIFAFDDMFTAEYVSKMMGEEEVIRHVEGETHMDTMQEGTVHTEGEQVGVNVNLNWSEADQESVTESEQKNMSIQNSVARSDGRVRGWNLNGNYGRNKGKGYKPGFLFDEDERKNRGSNIGFGGGINRSKNVNDTITKGTVEGQGSGMAKTASKTKNQGGGIGVQKSKVVSDAMQKSKGTSDGTSRNETIHKRWLAAIDELCRQFKRITDKEHLAYPGVALAMISGENPMWLMKTNYYEDLAFIRGFDPHPDHKHTPLVASTITISGPPTGTIIEMEKEGSEPFRITRWLAEPGTFLQAGAPLAEIAGDTLGWRTTTIHSPFRGWVSEVHVSRHRNGYANGHHGLRDAKLVTMTSYDSTYLVQQAHAVVPQNFLESIQQAQQALEQQRAAERQRQLAEAAERKKKEAEQQHIAELKRKLLNVSNAARVALHEWDRLRPKDNIKESVSTAWEFITGLVSGKSFKQAPISAARKAERGAVWEKYKALALEMEDISMQLPSGQGVFQPDLMAELMMLKIVSKW